MVKKFSKHPASAQNDKQPVRPDYKMCCKYDFNSKSGLSNDYSISLTTPGVDTNLKTIVACRATKFVFSLALSVS